MKKISTRGFDKYLDETIIFLEILLFLLMINVFINIIISIFTFELVEGLIRIGINVAFYMVILVMINLMKLTKKEE